MVDVDAETDREIRLYLYAALIDARDISVADRSKRSAVGTRRQRLTPARSGILPQKAV